MESGLAKLRKYLTTAQDMSQKAAETRTKELVYSFIGTTMDKPKARLAGKRAISAKEITSAILDVFQQSSDEVLKQVAEHGIN